MKRYFRIGLLILLITTSCLQTPRTQVLFPLTLATTTENNVTVSIQLLKKNEDKYLLSATFTPMEEAHLYSKDLPITGIDGVGRPTLLELSFESQIKPVGELIESVPSQEPETEPKALRVYPVGAVTLSLPIELPPGTNWVEESVRVTYMACTESGCKPPVMGKLISIQIPGANLIQ